MASPDMSFSRSRDDQNATVKKLLSVTDSLYKQAARSFNESDGGGWFGKLHYRLGKVIDKLAKLQDLHDAVQAELCSQLLPLEIIHKKMENASSPTDEIMREVEDITMKISGLMGKIPLLHDKSQGQILPDFEDSGNGGNNDRHIGIHELAEGFPKLEAFRQVEEKFMELEIVRKMCLLSFAVFPENREVHRTMLMYWWIGEGIVPVQGAEETVSEVLKEFTENKLLEPVEERRKVTPSSFKMTPFVHSSVIHLSQKIGVFDIYLKREKRMNLSAMGKVCLVEGSSQQEVLDRQGMLNRRNDGQRLINIDHMETMFNVAERYPDFTFKWFSEHPSNRKFIKLSRTLFKSLHVFYLGRWERTQKRHIHVHNPELMKCLKATKNLRLLSFQGISSFKSLKGSICKLHKLIVLDLRECSDLTTLPKKIDSLQSLVYLDMTGCYMLEWIPMRLALLKNLEVLKGFVVSETTYESVACTLHFLKRLKKLRKLSIDIRRDDLGVNQLMVDLVNLNALTKLKITWRRDLIRAGKPEEFTKTEISLPHQLRKLDLQRFPHDQLPTWLMPHNLLHLKKLHIGRGKTLRGFGDLPEKATECTVEILRLTSLPKLRVGWIELKNLYFPNLTFLENNKCPRVFLTPCDGNGIWRSDQDE